MAHKTNTKYKEKALSPMVAVFIIVALAMSVGLIVYNWTDGFSQKQLDKSSELKEEIEICNNVDGVLERVVLDIPNNTTKVVFQDMSTKNQLIKEVIVYNETMARCVYNMTNFIIETGEYITFNINNCSIFKNCDDFRAAMVSSGCGSFDYTLIKENSVSNGCVYTRKKSM